MYTKMEGRMEAGAREAGTCAAHARAGFAAKKVATAAQWPQQQNHRHQHTRLSCGFTKSSSTRRAWMWPPRIGSSGGAAH